MKEISLSTLVMGLRQAEETPTAPTLSVSDYVLTHIYQPLLQDEPVLFADLDFSAFDDYDLDKLEEYLEEHEAVKRSLWSLGETFCRAETVACRQRAYC